MKPIFSAAALLLAATAARADLSAQDILDNWQSYYAGFGRTLTTGQIETNGATTRINDFTAEMAFGGNSSRTKIAWMDITENADGSADIRFSPEGRTESTFTTGSGQARASGSIDASALTMHAVGDPGAITLTFAAAVVTMQQVQTRPDETISIGISFQDLQGEMRSVWGQDSSQNQSMAYRGGRVSASITTTPAEGPPIYITYNTDSLDMSYDSNLAAPPQNLGNPLLALFSEGSVLGMTASTGPATLVIDQKTPANGQRSVTFSQQSGQLDAAYAENTLSYALTADGGNVSFDGRAIEGSTGFDHAGFSIRVPIHKSLTPTPFAVSLALEGFTMSDNIWARFDPDSVFEHTPASFSIAFDGTAKVYTDIFSQTAFTVMRGASFDVQSLSLSSLALDVEGMGLTGSGDLRFDPQRRDPDSGLGEAGGVLDFSITGALGLLDKIGRLGIGDPMFIIGAKGALGMFAVPTDSADSFTSRIEFIEGGHISINGQQVK